MHDEIPKPQKKFKGFTSIFQNKAKKNVTKAPDRKPFNGFSDFYKRIKEYEVYDDDDDYDSLFGPFEPKKLPPPPIEKEEPPTTTDNHFKPQKYFEWCKERSKEAFDICAEQEGDLPYNEKNDGYERAGSIKANSLVMDIKKTSAYRKYDRDRKNYDRSEDGLSQRSTDDINPWFNKMLNKWRGGEVADENDVRFQEPEIDQGLRNIFEKLNAGETLFDHRFPRKVNTYPLEFQFRHLNKRMENFLEKTKRFENVADDDKLEKSSTIGSDKPNPWDFHSELPCQKKELEEYFNKLTKPKREVDFTLEDFKSWYLRMSFKYERRFKDLGDTKISPEPQDFNEWMIRKSEKSNQKYNEEIFNARKDLKPTPTRCGIRDTPKNELKNHSNKYFPSDLSRCNWSTSNVSSCRSMIEKLQ